MLNELIVNCFFVGFAAGASQSYLLSWKIQFWDCHMPLAWGFGIGLSTALAGYFAGPRGMWVALILSIFAFLSTYVWASRHNGDDDGFDPSLYDLNTASGQAKKKI